MDEPKDHYARNSPSRSFCVRAPGKCLLTGGYLILDADQKGLSVSVDAYTQATVTIESILSSQSIIHIKSVDLCDEWIYIISDKNHIEEVSNSSENLFLYYSIKAILDKGVEIADNGKKVVITVQNCNGFYYKDTKTGFGTSSTTVVSVVTAILNSWDVLHAVHLTTKDRELIVELSLQAHFLAQGKVGSGYDIITAVYGSCVFVKQEGQLGCSFEPFALPPSLCVLFSCGGKQSSKTSTFVKEIKKWREENDVDWIWKRYQENNQQLIDALTMGKDKPVDLVNLRALYREKLEIMHQISQLSHTEIVPDLLYELMKRTNEIEGVVGCVVAGAGGYDSFYCITDCSEDVKNRVERLWNEFDYAISTVQVKGSQLSLE